MDEDQTYKNGPVSDFWNPFLSSSSPSLSVTLVPATSYPRETLTAIFSAQMEPEFAVRPRSLTSGTIQDSSINTAQDGEDGSAIIKDERTYDDRNLFRHHTLSNPAFAGHGTTPNHPSLYNSYSPQYQFQPHYVPIQNSGYSDVLLPAAQLRDTHHRLHPTVNHQPNQSVLNNHVVVSGAPTATHETWNNVPRVSMRSLFTSTTPVVPWNPSSSSWIPTQQVQSLPDVRHSSYSQTHKGYISTRSAPMPLALPTGALDRPHPASSYNHMEDRTRADVDTHSGAIRNQRPHFGVRNRALSMVERPVSLDMAARGLGGRRGNPSGSPKRKPLPKIYGCENCGKKFDRPSTLKVHEAIHTGAKDYECEYCSRAFTVQSNMKRHMRVCKHKPLSPPFTLYEFYTTPSPIQNGQPHLLGSPSATISGPVSSFRPSTTSAPFRAPSVTFTGFAVVSAYPPMNIGQIDRSSSLPLNVRDMNQVSTVQTLSGDVPMIPYEFQLPTHHHQHSPQVAQKFLGYKAPMIIAAMFSVNQKVPNSLARFTLVRSDCEFPLSPVKPVEKYLVWYNITGSIFPEDTATTKDQDQVNADMYLNFDADVDAPTNASSSSITKPSVHSSIPSDSSTPSTGPLNPQKPEGNINGDGPDRNPQNSSGSQPAVIDISMRTKNLRPLPLDRFEERNSYFPRSRHCYHPAEYDPVGILPGPGIEDLAIDHEEANNPGGSL